MAQLAENHYGKSRVRLLRVSRTAAGPHTVDEWMVGVYLTGDFTACYETGDNTGLTATDTMKNAVYAVARVSQAATPEDYALELARFLYRRTPGAASVRVTVEAKTWKHLHARVSDGFAASPTAFLQRGPDVDTCTVTVARPGGEAQVVAGVAGLVILKTAHSAFQGFHRDELTTLPESDDRLLGTEATITWAYAGEPEDFAGLRVRVMDTLLTTFARHDSLSVQQTLYAMAEAVLAEVAEVRELELTMPNRHNNLVDLTRFQPPFASDNPNLIFVPTEEPHGQIHARVTR